MSAIGDRAAGFTLIEALVVLGILSLVSALAFPQVDKAMRGRTFADAAARVELGLQETRARALRQGAAARMIPDGRGHGFVTGERSDAIPDRVSLRFPPGGLVFFADGSASGGEVAIRDGTRQRRWAIDAVTGRIDRIGR